MPSEGTPKHRSPPKSGGVMSTHNYIYVYWQEAIEDAQILSEYELGHRGTVFPPKHRQGCRSANRAIWPDWFFSSRSASAVFRIAWRATAAANVTSLAAPPPAEPRAGCSASTIDYSYSYDLRQVYLLARRACLSA